ncbi:hypothetical protein [Aliiglaciecola sp. LCG003]|uniref:hypothetical protein n=1 Tax=Aliiglaciecola sp. LCG003 TaxID=3053655 RepID=UPI002572AA24|nr:hypothetical protein [Aliiglaciecola sp. LCG003]WJG08045.1 hypothetical protein QR722_11875 [Aliiglaciecola sp. LCG003]
MISLLVLALAATCILGINSNINAATENMEQKNSVKSLETRNIHVSETLAEFKHNTESSLSVLLSKVDEWLVDPDNTSVDAIKMSLLANETIENIENIEQKEDISFSMATEIRYFVKEVDQQRVWKSLTVKGISVSKSAPTLKNAKTNAIWFGDQVDIEEVKYVALTLIRAGISITSIKPFSGANRKVNIIEIGHDVDFENNTPLSVQQVVNAKQFLR